MNSPGEKGKFWPLIRWPQQFDRCAHLGDFSVLELLARSVSAKALEF
jgi:hypothetical protein